MEVEQYKADETKRTASVFENMKRDDYWSTTASILGIVGKPV